VDSLNAVAKRAIELLEGVGASYAIMGGLAVRLYALPRATYDIDFVITLAPELLPKFYLDCENAGFTIPEAQRTGWIESVAGFPVVKLQWAMTDFSIDVDLFLAESPFQHEILRRRLRAGANGWQAWFVSVEDLILLKLMAGRRKDLADVADVLPVQGPLDEAYLHAWAERLKVADGLRQALSERPA
jgi:predicted nucleotidyltransferase